MNYTVTLCNEDNGTGDTLGDTLEEVEASSERQAVLVAIHQMGWRNHARVTVYQYGQIEGWAEDQEGKRFFFSGQVLAGPEHAVLRKIQRSVVVAEEELKTLQGELEQL